MKKISLKRKKKSNEAQSRITNETVAEDREKILAGGRKFKYPHQYVRHKLVINALLISLVVVVAVVAIGWWQLYKVQTTSELAYRTTRVLPLPVGSVDGKQIRYSDYLMRYRSQDLWLQKNGQLGIDAKSDQKQLDFYKRAVLDELIKDIYAEKIASERSITISEAEVQATIDASRNTATGKISQEVYDASTKDTLGYSPDEYRRILYQSLVRHKVSYAVDEVAQKLRDQLASDLSNKKDQADFREIVAQYKKKGVVLDFGASGIVARSNRDGGLSQAAVKLKPNDISSAIESTSGDGYYFIQLLSIDQKRLSYQYIRVPLVKFESMLREIKQQGKVQEYITLTRDNQQKQ